MPESYMQVKITWPELDLTQQATRRDTRIGKQVPGGTPTFIYWDDWRTSNFPGTGVYGRIPEPDFIKQYHGLKIYTECRDYIGNVVGPTRLCVYEVTDNIAPEAPGPISILKEQQSNGYLKFTFGFTPTVDWQLVTQRRIRITKTFSGQSEFTVQETYQAADDNVLVFFSEHVSASDYLYHTIHVTHIDNHSNESSETSNNFYSVQYQTVPNEPGPTQFETVGQVKGPEFGGPP